MKRTRLIFASDIHYCEDGWYGLTGPEKGNMLCEDLAREYADDPYEALLLLGDYSLDHWMYGGTYLNQGLSETQRFVDEVLGRLAPKGVEVRMIAGNHEQFGEENWTRMTGHKRSDYLVCDDVLFILCDTYGGNLDPTIHSDGTYVGVNVEHVKALMAQFPDKRVILCAHWFHVKSESEEFREMLRTEDRILCLICGHMHISRVLSTGEENGNKPILYTGHFSYSSENNPLRCLKGYRELVIDGDRITSKYIVPSHTCTIENVRFTNEYTEQDAIEIV